MIVPEYWAEARIQRRFKDRQVTVRRFGWSDASQFAAEQHARQRVAEAFERVVNGEKIPRLERKVRYGGTDGLPIREEIVDRQGDCVITRNSYGARCLNSPDVFFADVDIDDLNAVSNRSLGLIGLVVILTCLWIALANNMRLGVNLLMGLQIIWFLLQPARNLWIRLRGGETKMAIRRVHRFTRRHPQWHLRIYETPAGLRLLAMHQLFDPRSKEVEQAFLKLKVDPVYVVMCQKQNCFRARLTAKPWRINITERLRPRGSAWPVKQIYMPGRKVWIHEYESSARNFAACRFIEAAGMIGRIDPEAQRVCDYHDRECQVNSPLELA